MRLILLLTFLSVGFTSFSQNTFQGKEVNLKSSSAVLSEQFKDWKIYEISSSDIFTQLQQTSNESQINLNLGKDYQWQLSLFPNDMRGLNYQVRNTDGVVPHALVNKAFEGYEQILGGNVRLTVDEDFIYGYIESGGEQYFIEPLWYFDADAPKNQFIVYDAHDVIPNKNATCAAVEMDNHTEDLKDSHNHNKSNTDTEAQRIMGVCYDVELAIASDFSMFQKYGNIAGVENHNTGVMNNVQGNYDDEFNDELNFVIVTQFVSDCNTCDPWSASTNAGTLLNSFRTWGNGGGFGVTFDVAQLWTDRNLDGATVGVAFVGTICGNSRYQVLQDFSANAQSLRVLTAHELGHNFDATHDAAGSGFIMAPAVNNTTTWSAASISDIDAFVASLNCLSPCAAPVPPVAGFTSNIQSICEGSDVQFFDQSNGLISSRVWTFTGGTPATSTLANPEINYPTAGTYPVSLLVTNNAGSNTSNQTGFITVGPNGTNILLYDAFENGLGDWTIENPNGNITWAATPVGGSVLGNSAVFMDNWSLNGSGQRDGLISQPMDFSGFTNITMTMDYAYALFSGNLNFVDSLVITLSTDGGNTFPITVFSDGDDGTGSFATTQPQLELEPTTAADWCFGGTFGSGCIQLDLSPYIGQTNVILKIENVNDFGNNLYLDNVLISSDCQLVLPPDSDFVGTPTQGCEPLTVTYTDMSQNGPSSWSWSFPGGTPSSSTDQNPVVVYNNPGNYDVTLTTTNSAGADVENKVDYIEVLSAPMASFTPIVFNGNQVAFTNTSTLGTIFNWDFGDGNSSSQSDPLHTYTVDGIYTVTLTVINACGVSTITEMVEITTQPVAGFSATPTGGCEPLTVQFSDQSSANVSGWSWDFPGGTPSTSTDQNPSVTFSSAGTYSVSLTVTNASGVNTISQTNYITVDPAPTSSFTQNTNGLTATFTNTSINATTYSWDFGDGNSSTLSDPTHTYNTDGTYTVVLTATSNCGSVTSTETVTILTAPVAGFSSDVTSGCAPLTVQFVNSSSLNATSWNWIFQGGTPATSTDENPIVTFNSTGLYTVTLEAINSAGMDIFIQTDYIIVDDVPVVGFSQNANGQTISFINTSTNATSFTWDFGDGNTSSDISPTHTYNTDGTYIVTLVASNNCGSVVMTETVTISTLPSAGFSSNVTSGCAPLTIQFTDQSSTNSTVWNWSFPGGNPSSSTQQNPSVTYNNAGTYSVTLQVTNGAGENTITQTDLIVIDDVPVAGYTQVTNGLSVNFTNTSTNATNYNWDFGDGNTSTQSDPSHTYAVDGTYNVVLSATNNCGTVTSTQTITIGTMPNAGFGANVTSGCLPFTVQFNDQSSSNTTSWNWTFPGGTPSSSTEQNPIVVYNTVGAYGVTLEVSNTSGNNINTQTNFIIVDDVASASFSQNTNGATVDFTNSSTNATTYSWDFGDGNSSAQSDPSHTYNADGTYTVVLSATNNCGTVTSTQTVTIATPPTAGFIVTETNGCAPLTVQFTDQSSANTTNWNWTFTDGNPSSSTDQNPSVTYTSAGTYSVTLEASNTAGESTVTQTDFIIVDDVPVASFSENINGVDVDFTNTSTNANSYNWDFGDGNLSTQSDPNHTYSMDGVYTVTMTASNGCGSVTTTSQVTIVTLPSAGFGSNVTSGCADLTVEFNDQSSANATGWVWTFPGGNPSSSTDQDPIVIYQNAGTYPVTLTVTNAAGENTIEQMNYIVVDDVPFIDFSTDVNTFTVDLTNGSTNATTYNWDFGDGNTSNEINPSHTYTGDGNFTITLTATNNCGSVSLTEMVTIANTPTAGYISSQNTGCDPLEIQFTDQSSNNTIAWEWTFPGGIPSTSTQANPVVVYNTSGQYSVTLVAVNNVGTDTFTLVDYVTINTTPSADFGFDVNGPIVEFENQTINGTTYFWDLGDGNTSTDPNPNHQYALNGDYVVTLNATNDCGTTTITQIVSVTSSIIAGFTADIISGCMPLEVQFNNQSINSTSYLWTFVGGTPTTSTDENPVVIYNNAGVYTVMLEAINATGSSIITETAFIVVESLPFANFDNTVNGFTANFTNFSTFGDTYFWDFGDGTTSTEINPEHTYGAFGVYPVTLTVTNDCGTNTFTMNVDIGTTVVASFSASQNEGCAPLQVQFSDESSNNTTAWNWTFSGGSPSTSTEQNPTITFNTPGTYEVILEASNSFNSNTITQTNYITVFDIPTADFSSSIAGAIVDFTNNSTNATSYNWSFGDGSTSTVPDPQHIYSNDGTYTVILEAVNPCGSIITEQTVTIVTPVLAGFTSDINSGCAGLVVEFSDNSSSNTTEWNWTFPGGTPSISTVQNPVVTYNTPGAYAVTLEASNASFSATQTEMSYIFIDDVPSVGFTTTTNGAIVEFTNTSNNANTYLWNFGDGNMSTEANPTHTYATAGDFTVVLTATNDCGSSTTEVTVTSTFLPTANFFIQNMMDCAPATIQFVDNSTSNTTSWNWTFDGGSPNTSSVQNPAITFNTAGVHEITLVASNAAGSSTFSLQITLDSPPVVDFSSSVNLLTTTFTNLSTNANTYFWDLGDGNSSTDQNPIHTYATGGNYNVILTATNACGTTTFLQQVEVLGPQAVAGFIALESQGCTPFTVEFEDTSIGAPTAWSWEFPGGSPSTSTEQHPTVVYNNVGTYDVTLTVSNPAGNSEIVQMVLSQ